MASLVSVLVAKTLFLVAKRVTNRFCIENGIDNDMWTISQLPGSPEICRFGDAVLSRRSRCSRSRRPGRVGGARLPDGLHQGQLRKWGVGVSRRCSALRHPILVRLDDSES